MLKNLGKNTYLIDNSVSPKNSTVFNNNETYFFKYCAQNYLKKIKQNNYTSDFKWHNDKNILIDYI